MGYYKEAADLPDHWFKSETGLAMIAITVLGVAEAYGLSIPFDYLASKIKGTSYDLERERTFNGLTHHVPEMAVLGALSLVAGYSRFVRRRNNHTRS